MAKRQLVGNYITNMSLQQASGGWNGMNAALHAELAKHFQLQYVGPINPPSLAVEQFWARLQKLMRLPQQFYFFSPTRLNKIAKLVVQQSFHSASFDYFHGVTPWIASSILRPTFAFTDACFSTYYDTYHRHDKFKSEDRQRISHQERNWLQRLTRVFFSSRYAIDECCQRYGLEGKNFEYVGVGARIDTPDSDLFAGGHKLIFIAVDFARKGGEVCVEAFRRFRQRFSDATLTLIGACPPSAVLELPGVTWVGFLSKEVPEQLQQLKHHLSTAFALVLPTVSDMTPLVLAEAALHGCPTVAPRAFGIPEMIQDGRTGRLLNTPPDAADFALALEELANDPSEYAEIRKTTRAYALTHFTWAMVGQRVASAIVRDLEMIDS